MIENDDGKIRSY